MHGFGPLEGLGAIIVWLIIFFPVIKILQKAGYSGWWVLIWFVPLANVVFLWIFAFADWPNLRKSPAPT